MKKCPYFILYEDEDIIVVYKERDVFSIPTDDVKTKKYNLYHYLSLYSSKKGEKIYLVHRLDFETSGIMIFAKSIKVEKILQREFENRLVVREYEAVIKEKIPLKEKFAVNMMLDTSSKTVKESNCGKESITHIQSINYINIGTAMKINIKTGRRNQIRMAINKLGYTLIGDKRYSKDAAKRMYLNCFHLSFKAEILKKRDFYIKPLWIKEGGEDERI